MTDTTELDTATETTAQDAKLDTAPESNAKPAKDIHVIALTAKQLQENGLGAIHFIEVNELGRYGFTNEIINDMVEYEIFPQLYKIRNKIVVIKKEIFGIVEVLLRRSMQLYKAVDARDQAAELIAKEAISIAELNAKIEDAKANGATDTESVAAYIATAEGSIGSEQE